MQHYLNDYLLLNIRCSHHVKASNDNFFQGQLETKHDDTQTQHAIKKYTIKILSLLKI